MVCYLGWASFCEKNKKKGHTHAQYPVGVACLFVNGLFEKPNDPISCPINNFAFRSIEK